MLAHQDHRPVDVALFERIENGEVLAAGFEQGLGIELAVIGIFRQPPQRVLRFHGLEQEAVPGTGREHGVETGIDVSALMDAAEDVATPIMGKNLPRIGRESLTLGYAGVYSSFLLHAKRAEERHGIPAREILLELGRRGTVGGQEDMIEDVALEMIRQKRG